MLARRSGKVINIASWTAHQGGVIWSCIRPRRPRWPDLRGAGARMGALRRARQCYIARPFSRCRDVRRRASTAKHAACRADRAAQATWAAAGSRTAGALPGVRRVGLHRPGRPFRSMEVSRCSSFTRRSDRGPCGVLRAIEPDYCRHDDQDHRISRNAATRNPSFRADRPRRTAIALPRSGTRRPRKIRCRRRGSWSGTFPLCTWLPDPRHR